MSAHCLIVSLGVTPYYRCISTALISLHSALVIEYTNFDRQILHQGRFIVAPAPMPLLDYLYQHQAAFSPCSWSNRLSGTNWLDGSTPKLQHQILIIQSFRFRQEFTLRVGRAAARSITHSTFFFLGFPRLWLVDGDLAPLRVRQTTSDLCTCMCTSIMKDLASKLGQIQRYTVLGP